MMFGGIAFVLVVASFLLRLYRIDGQELWIDEALSFHRATTAGGLRPDVVIDPSPPLYYLLLRFWIPLFGSDETGLRLMSAVLGALFVWLAIWAGRALFNSRVGLWSGVFAATAPIHIYYSQEARPYALLMTLIMLTIVLLSRALRSGSIISWILATATGLLALFTHYFAVLALVPGLGLALVGADRALIRRRMHGMAKAILVCGVVFLPWLWWAYVMTPHSAAEYTWVQPWWEKAPPALVIPQTLEVLTLGGHDHLRAGGLAKIFLNLPFPPALRFVGLGFFLLLAVWVAIAWFDDRLEIPNLRQLKTWLWAMLFLPLVLLWLISLYRPVYLVGRYDLIVFPALTLLVGLGLAKLQVVAKSGLLLLLALVLGLAVPIGAKLVRYYAVASNSIPPSARATAGALVKLVGPGDVVVFTGLRGIPVLYYLDRLGYSWAGGDCIDSKSGRRFGCRMFPKETERSPATYDTARVSESSEAIRDDVQLLLSALSQPDRVLWLVLGNGGYSDGRLQVPEPDLSFMAELQSRGLRLEYVNLESTAGVFKVTGLQRGP